MWLYGPFGWPVKEQAIPVLLLLLRSSRSCQGPPDRPQACVIRHNSGFTYLLQLWQSKQHIQAQPTPTRCVRPTDIPPPFAPLCLAHTGCVAVCSADSSSSGRSSSSSRRLLEGNAAVATQAAATAQAAAAAKTAAASQAAAASKPASSTTSSAAGKPAGTGQPRVGVAAGHPAFSAGGVAQDLAHISADNQVTKQGGHTGHKRKQHIHVVKGGYTASPTPPSDYASTSPASPEEDTYGGKDESKDKSEESTDESTESKKDPTDSDYTTKPKAPTVKKIVKKKRVRFRVQGLGQKH